MRISAELVNVVGIVCQTDERPPGRSNHPRPYMPGRATLKQIEPTRTALYVNASPCCERPCQASQASARVLLSLCVRYQKDRKSLASAYDLPEAKGRDPLDDMNR